VTTTAERAVVTVASGRPSPLLMSTCRVLGRLVARSLFRIRTTGDRHVPRDGPVLLAGNHSGFLDGPLVYLLAPRPAAGPGCGVGWTSCRCTAVAPTGPHCAPG
jgi:1-acyl-sn-glycerol-3-phosphate acyltransferase